MSTHANMVQMTTAPGHRLPFAHADFDGTLRIEVAKVIRHNDRRA